MKPYDRARIEPDALEQLAERMRELAARAPLADDASTWCVAAAATLVLGGVTLWIVGCLTVMGFGKVSIRVNSPEAEVPQ